MVYEDGICKITYNFWCDGGNSGFVFENKTDNTIYIDLAKSFYIKNGVAYDYYLNRTYSQGTSSNLSLSNTASIGENVQTPPTTIATNVSNSALNSIEFLNTKKNSISQSKSISFKENAVICIPTHASKTIIEYAINKELYRSCDYLLYPQKKQIKTIPFNQSNSPVIFSNTIAFKIGEDGALKHIVNNFYVSEVMNISQRNELKKYKTEDCEGHKITNKYMKDFSVDKFYISYLKEYAKY
jgi:hypothetical protein